MRNDRNDLERDLMFEYKEYESILNEIEIQKKMIAEEEAQLIKQEDIDEDDKALINLSKEELNEMMKNVEEMENKLCYKLVKTIDYDEGEDESSVHVEIRAGTGGVEACLFTEELNDMYMNYINKHPSWRYKLVEKSEGDDGVKDVTFMVDSSDPEDSPLHQLKYEHGVHRVQRVPKTEKSGRVHTSAVTVAVLPKMKPFVAKKYGAKEFKIETMRASGPGGQGVNKVDSAVRVTHIESGISMRCQEERDQQHNRQIAMSYVLSKLLEREREEHAAEKNKLRSTVGGGDRSEKIRTYNYKQSRITDHRVNISENGLAKYMKGEAIDQFH
eukprot:CAMPEP_0117419204 /NCGR_PEP_ID=MMETSP0758-20121206/820_1 /TAXON_ID=63605 /ORGANISM="Percolomonas cosmopolitus, Strain AE-1 (ATCC 50343)" /LENGTH=328 /DNA_ID=CAMNT_0005200143 /DNA_START=1125 /DNA_END=2108 /DNA_ORIENTATION=+